MYDITAYGASTANPDNSSAINNAIFAASTAGGGTVGVPVGRWKVTNPITLRKGVILIGDGQVIYDYSTASISGGSILEMNHVGVGIYQQESSQVFNLGFDYPGQDPNAVNPTVYGPTIQLAGVSGNYDQRIIGNWFHKAFLAMDLRGSVVGLSSGGLTVADNEGCPLHGMAVDYVADWQSFRNNKFNSGKMNPLHLTTGLVAWCMNNAFAIQLGGNDWVTVENCEFWGYGTGCHLIPGSGYNASGPYEFQNCSFDACKTGIQVNSGVYHHPIRVFGCTFAPYGYPSTKGAAVAMAYGADLRDGGLQFVNNYVFGPHNQILWAGNSVQWPSNMLISGNIGNATVSGGGDWAIWSDKGNNVQVVNNVFRGYVNGTVNLNTTTNGVVANNQS